MEKITIKKIGRKALPNKYKPGETYNLTTILDDTDRKLTTTGTWADNWQIGDEIEGEIKEKKWMDKDGFEQVSLTIENPNKKPFIPRENVSNNPVIVSYQIAAQVFPVLFKDRKSPKLDDLVALAEKIKEQISGTTPEVKTSVPSVDVNKEQAPVKKQVVKDSDFDEEEEEEAPF